MPLIEKYLREGRRVFLDSDPRLWLPCGWQRDEIPEIVNLENHFHFRRVSETIYELRPQTDNTASDDPNLQRLRSENRPASEEVPPGRRVEREREREANSVLLLKALTTDRAWSRATLNNHVVVGYV